MHLSFTIQKFPEVLVAVLALSSGNGNLVCGGQPAGSKQKSIATASLS